MDQSLHKISLPGCHSRQYVYHPLPVDSRRACRALVLQTTAATIVDTWKVFRSGWSGRKRRRYWSGLGWSQHPIVAWIEANGLSWHEKAEHGLAFVQQALVFIQPVLCQSREETNGRNSRLNQLFESVFSYLQERWCGLCCCEPLVVLLKPSAVLPWTLLVVSDARVGFKIHKTHVRSSSPTVSRVSSNDNMRCHC